MLYYSRDNLFLNILLKVFINNTLYFNTMKIKYKRLSRKKRKTKRKISMKKYAKVAGNTKKSRKFRRRGCGCNK